MGGLYDLGGLNGLDGMIDLRGLGGVGCLGCLCSSGGLTFTELFFARQ